MTDRPAERTASRPQISRDDTASRPPLTERIQAKLANAADEHRANARAESQPVTKKSGGAPGRRPPRRARLRLTRIDPWSVMKTAFLLSIALGVVTIVSVLMVWSVLGAAGVWDSINTTVRDIVGDQANQPFTIQDYLGTDRVIGFT